ncbi:MAG: phage terminase large subunit family protein [Methylophilaceae bacterium]|nr:terminase gpA endonuclease subunit [Methyloradius sp.]
MGAFDSAAVDAFRLIDLLWADNFAPRIPLSVDEWADKNRVLPAGSAEPGPWRTSRLEAARQIYQDLSDDNDYEDVVLICATQLLKSEAGLNWLGWIIEESPGPVMLVQATVNTGKRYSRMRVAPMIQASPSLRRKVHPAKSRDAANSTSMKEFPGGIVIITGANSAAELASMPMKYIHFDERDDYPDDVEGQGDPVSIGKARQDTFRRRKRLTSSSPKRPKGHSPIEADYERGTQFKYHVPCPHCGHYQELVWAHLRWHKTPEPQPESAVYECQGLDCGALIEEHHKDFMLSNGRWVARYPDRKVRSYHMNSLYSPIGWLSWADLVSEWLDANTELQKGNDEKHKTFINTRLAETVAEQATVIAANDLMKTAEDFPLKIVPMGGLIVVVAVDVQDDRLEAAAWAFGQHDEKWLFDTVKLMGNPGEKATWDLLDAYLNTRFRHESGQTLPIEAVGIDTGGHYTHMVYNFVRLAHPARKIAAIKGDNHKAGIPILGRASNVDVNWRGGVIKGGCKLWMIGVNTAKDLLHNQLKRPGQVHLSKYLEPEVFDQLVAEKRVSQRTARGTRYMWVKPSNNTRNEQLDLAVIAMWCAERIGLSRYPQAVWDKIRERVQPMMGGLFDQPASQPVAQAAEQAAAVIENARQPRTSAAPNRMPRQGLLGKIRNGR